MVQHTMARVRVLTIGLDSNTDVFSPGDVVRGQIILQVDSNRDQEGLKNVQGLWVKIKGKAKISFPITFPDGHGGTTTTEYSKKEKYFDNVCVLFGAGKRQRSATKLHIPPGTLAYPFKLQIPNQVLPAAFEHTYGYIRYKVKATLSLIRTFSKNKTFKTEKLFSVTGPIVDLNAMPQIQSAVQKDKELYSCCGCGSTVEKTITLGLPKQGYVPGESLFLIGHADNRDRKEWCDFHVKFIQRMTFLSTSRQTERVETTKGSVQCRVATPRGRVTHFSLGPMLIPPLPPSDLPGCSIIDIKYRVQCSGDDGKWTFPIVIGTVPLRVQAPFAFPTAPPATTQYSSASVTAPEFPVGVPASAPGFGGETPPPSYEQAVGQIDRLINKRNEEDYERDDQFVPSYPYFNLSVDVPPDSS